MGSLLHIQLKRMIGSKVNMPRIRETRISRLRTDYADLIDVAASRASGFSQIYAKCTDRPIAKSASAAVATACARENRTVAARRQAGTLSSVAKVRPLSFASVSGASPATRRRARRGSRRKQDREVQEVDRDERVSSDEPPPSSLVRG